MLKKVNLEARIKLKYTKLIINTLIFQNVKHFSC